MIDEENEPLPHTFVIPVNETTQDSTLSRVISYECAKNYLKLKKNVYDENTFNTLYSTIFRKAKEYIGDGDSILKRNPNNFDIFRKMIYIPGRSPNFFYGMSGEIYHTSSMREIISSLFPISFLTIDLQNGALTIIPTSWHIYLICNPFDTKAYVYNLDDTFNYIVNALQDVHMECNIMTR